MYKRHESLDEFIRAAKVIFEADSLPDAGRLLATNVFKRLELESDDGTRNTQSYPACRHLDSALAPIRHDLSAIGAAARAIKVLEPNMSWQRRTSGPNGSENYIENHVNGMICGPRGMESRHDVHLGLSLLAPNTRYPDHKHPPEEAYVLLTAGEFWQEDRDWFEPGVGGGLHNTPNIFHAMRSGAVPLLAVWCLLI